MSRRKLIAANWKMNLTLEQAAEWLAEVEEHPISNQRDVVVFPSFIFITDLMDMYEGDQILFGAQNCSHLESGAYTGEVSAMQIASAGIDYVLVGHSERRNLFAESNLVVGQKLKQAVKHDLFPVFCCGEPKEVREAGEQNNFVMQQLQDGLFVLNNDEITSVTIAYEPVWAIGTGLNATARQAQEMHEFIRQQVEKKYGPSLANEIRILYGGSCKPANARELMQCPDVDGVLVGGASLVAEDFIAIINAAV